MDNASRFGNINTLNWWLNSGLKLEYSENSIALCYGDSRDVLNWWINSDLTIKIPNNIIPLLCKEKNVIMLDWWLKSGLKFKFDSDEILRIIYNDLDPDNYHNILKCFENNHIKLGEYKE
ncbi:ankyrin repeat protein [Acanthamoeba polyphaga moumouvirus]|uniref:Ankyrin repeat protein n=2 Tax=Moumouvirus TaxID=3080801 RepID=L7RD78_9VIRU|nr:ankyrin repeat protein [Acanthamoeba polyphaga moumouvirus]AEX62329.1 putative ankyrin repeat protein [Moumouvirus Monve]AGC02312.1 ankyrin repeat protein [Acanthamoeba polyphaga moumouvirus]AQN68657.1 ankyrin repeat protein [Saudi moumouvirus]